MGAALMGSGEVGTDPGYRLVVEVAYDAQERPYEQMSVRLAFPSQARFPLFAREVRDLTVTPSLHLPEMEAEAGAAQIGSALTRDRLLSAPYKSLDIEAAREEIRERIAALQAALDRPILRVIHDSIEELDV